MRKLRFLLIVVFTYLTMSVMAIEPSSEIVSMNGKRYYVHTVEQGHTLYSLANAYGVTQQQIIESNVGVTAETLKAGDKIYIPVVETSKRDAKRGKKRTTVSSDDPFTMHEVKQGETLYSIAVSYKMPLAIIEGDNPDIVADSLGVGQVLRIRRSEMGTANARQLEREYKSRQKVEQGSDTAGTHVVMPGETVYSLSRRYNLSEKELLLLNNMSDASELCAGMTIRTESDSSADDPLSELPQMIDSLIERGEADAYAFGDDSILDSLVTEPVDVEFVRLGRVNTLKAVVMLPFHMRGKVNPNYVDFYRGVLLAMEDLKDKGYSIDLSVFDTENSATRIKDIVSFENAMLDAQLIIGPVHEDELRHVLGHAEDNNIPVISPLADVESLSSPVLFQMQSENDYKNIKFEPFVADDRDIITIYAATNDSAYIAEIAELKGDRPERELIFTFNREPYFYERRADGTKGVLVDFKALLRSGNKKTFFVVADRDTDIDRILTTLASTKSSLTDRGTVIGEYVVVGNRKWSRLDNIERQSFFRNNVAFLVPYHAKRTDYVTRRFDARYLGAYRTMPSMFSYRGYDAAMIFCERMFTGLENITNETIKPLGTTYHFEQKDGIYVNTEWTLVQYNSNFTIDVK